MNKNTDHVGSAKARLIEQDKNRQFVNNVVEALVSEAQPAEDALWQLYSERGIDTAVGQQLDDIGKLVVQTRDGLTDDEYRSVLKAVFAANNSEGIVEDILRVLVGIVGEDKLIEIMEYPPASFEAKISGGSVSETIAARAAKFLRRATSAGVGSYFVYSSAEDADTFVFSDSTGATSLEGDTFDTMIGTLDLEQSSSQYAFITDAAQTGLDFTGDLTIAALIKPESFAGGSMTILSKYAGAGSRSYTFLITVIGSTYYLTFTASADGTVVGSVGYTWAAVAGTEYHVAVTFDVSGSPQMEDQVLFYIDGVAITPDVLGPSALGSIYNSGTEVRVGARGDSTRYFDGEISRVRAWNAVLTPTEIAAEAASPVAVKTANLQGDWQLSEDYVDDSTNSNDLTAVNAPVFTAKTAAGIGGIFSSVREG